MNARKGGFIKIIDAIMGISAIGLLFVPGLAGAQVSVSPLDSALLHLEGIRGELGLSTEDLANKVVTDQVTSRHSQVTHIYFAQTLSGIQVANATLNVNVAGDGRVLNANSRFVPNLASRVNLRQPALSAAAAIARGAESLGLPLTEPLVQVASLGGVTQAARFSPAGISLEEIPAKLAYYATSSGEVRLTWDIVIHQTDSLHWWNLWVDADSGDVLARNDWIQNDTYEVFAVPKESPSDGPRTVELNPADPTASPFGWHDNNGSPGAEFTITFGNNVRAQEDRDANNSGGFSPNGGAGLDFQFPLDLATQSPVEYQAAAITNLFYWNNILHDILFQYGFDEASGNFQEANYTGAPGSGDPVLADAQDGSGTNNANFGTPPDGFAPRMQMFEWLPSFDHEVEIDAPSSAAGLYTASSAVFGPALNTTGVSAGIRLADDGTAPTTDGCESFSAGFFSGQIALIDRGSCSFVTKVRNAQNAGAVAVIVANNAGDQPITMGDDGTGGDIVISSVMVGQSDGLTIRNGLPATGTAREALNPPLTRDSDLDNGVIAHEYCHGLSNRLTGGRTTTNCLTGSQQAGEGWSDLCALFLTPDPADTSTTARGVGTYVSFEPPDGNGIRTFPYTTDLAVNPLTYGDLVTAGQVGGLTVPHGVGTVWATAVWEVYWNLVDTHGFDPDLYNGTGGNNLAIQLVVDGLKLQPCNPTFVEARDAILMADQVNNGGANQCLIWEGFAKRGLGINADDGGSSGSLAVTEDFTLPPECVVGCGNGICEAGEDCNTCPGDCIGGTTSGAVCGNGVCETGDGEDCVSCPSDCNGTQGGRPANRFCCGDGDGQSPVDCNDSRCTSAGFQCTDVPSTPTSFCCGDLTCEGSESCGNCAIDCTLGVELCTGNVDEDCDGLVDCLDVADCGSDPVCNVVCALEGESCRNNEDCCSNNCSSGNPSTRVCLP